MTKSMTRTSDDFDDDLDARPIEAAMGAGGAS